MYPFVRNLCLKALPLLPLPPLLQFCSVPLLASFFPDCEYTGVLLLWVEILRACPLGLGNAGSVSPPVSGRWSLSHSYLCSNPPLPHSHASSPPFPPPVVVPFLLAFPSLRGGALLSYRVPPRHNEFLMWKNLRLFCLYRQSPLDVGQRGHSFCFCGHTQDAVSIVWIIRGIGTTGLLLNLVHQPPVLADSVSMAK